MPFKINISDKGKTHKLETESEVLVGKSIGDKFKGEEISSDLEGYELEITGISDSSGHPGFKGLEGTAYHRRLLKYGPGMHDRRKGIRLKKFHRGEEISLKITQINSKVIKEGKTKFDELLAPKTEAESTDNAQPEQTKTEEQSPKEKPAEEKKGEKPRTEEKPAETPKQ